MIDAETGGMMSLMKNLYIYMHVWLYVCFDVCMHVFTYVCTHVYMHVGIPLSVTFSSLPPVFFSFFSFH